jgi:hypothetical protein
MAASCNKVTQHACANPPWCDFMVTRLVTSRTNHAQNITTETKCDSISDARKKTHYTGCNTRNGPDFGRVFLMLNCTEKPQNTYIQSSMVTEI